MPQKITELQNQLEKIIKGKKDITDKILIDNSRKKRDYGQDTDGNIGEGTCPSGRCAWCW